MHWSLVFSLIWLSAALTNGQRRAVVYYSLTSPEEVEAASENPLSSSINSIQTGREELISLHRGDTGSGGAFRRGYHKTTTPDYLKDSFEKADGTSTGKPQYGQPTKAPEVVINAPRNGNDDKGSGTYEVPTDNRRSGDVSLFKDKRSSGLETPSSSSGSVRPVSIPKMDETSFQKMDRAKGSVDVVSKDTPVREQDRRSNTHESRRQTTTPSFPLSTRFNTTGRDSSDRHRDDLPDKNQNDRGNRDRRPTTAVESAPRGHRTSTRSTSDKAQILTNTPMPRILADQSYDKAEQPSVSSGTHDRKVVDRPLDNRGSSFRNEDEKKKELDAEPDTQDKAYPAGNLRGTKVRDDRGNSTVVNKPTHTLVGEERPVESPRSPDVYRHEFRGGGKDDSNGKVGTDTDKLSRTDEGKTYVERPYVGDDEEKPLSHQGREYTRSHRDRYDERYDERPLKDRQTHRNRERNVTYYSQGTTASRSSRPAEGGYDQEYGDDGYPQRDVVKDADNIPKERTRVAGRRPYGIDGDVEDRDRYTGDSTRTYRDYSDDRRYRDEVPVDRDGGRKYRDEDNRKYRDDDSRTYDDYDDKDRYNRRYESDSESRRYGDNVTRTYASSGSRRYGDEEVRRYPTEYDRPAHRYEDDDEYTYNSSQVYRGSYDGYRGDNRRSSGESGSSRRYDESDGIPNSRYDDEEYGGSRSYRAGDNDRKYTRRDNETTSRQRDADTGYREADAEGRYRDETRVYSESSSKDRYDRDNRRTSQGDGTSYSGGTRSYRDRVDTNTRKDYDDTSRQRDSDGSQGSRGDESYRSHPYADEYYNNRSSPGYVDRYAESDRPRRRTDVNDSLSFATSDDDNRRYPPRYSDERRRDRDRAYLDVPVRRRQTDIDDTRRDKTRVYDDDRLSDRSRGDTSDDRTSRGRGEDEYTPRSRDRVKDYDARVYRDSDEDIETRNYRGRADSDVTYTYRGDDSTRDRGYGDEFKRTRPEGSRKGDKDYVDRRYEEEYSDRSSDGTYRYREEDERYRYTPSENRKPEYRDPERRNRGTQRFRDDYDEPYDKDYSIPQNSDERHRSGDRSNRREERLAGDRSDFDDKALEKPPRKTDIATRDDTKTEFPSPKGEGSSRYDEERRRDGRRSPSRDSEPDVGISGTQRASTADSIPPKSRISGDTVDSLDKGDFARGRRTSFFSEDGKTDPDRDDGTKRSRDDRRPRRPVDSEGLSYTRDEKDRGSTYDTRDLRKSDRPNLRPSTEGRIYSTRRDNPDAGRDKGKDEIPVSSRIPTDLLPVADDTEYSERTEDIGKSTISRSNEGAPRRRYSSTSYDRGARRRLPTMREPEMDRTTRRGEPELKSEDPLLPENRGRYRYTNSRGDPEDFVRHPDADSFAPGGEYVPRGTSSGGRDADGRDMLKGEYDSPGPGTPTRSKEDRAPTYPGHHDKDEYYPPSRDKAPLPPPRSSKPLEEFDRREKVSLDRHSGGRDERGMYANGEYPRSSPQDDEKFKSENSTRDRFESSNGEVRAKKENDPSSPVVSQIAPSSVRNQGSSISRSATPIPHYQGKEFISRNVSSKTHSDTYSGAAVTREKRFQYDDRSSTHNTTRSGPSMGDELSKRPLTTKEVIEAAYRHSEEPDKQREVFYPVYVPSSSNMTSPDVIRPSERRGLTTPTKKKKKK